MTERHRARLQCLVHLLRTSVNEFNEVSSEGLVMCGALQDSGIDRCKRQEQISTKGRKLLNCKTLTVDDSPAAPKRAAIEVSRFCLDTKIFSNTRFISRRHSVTTSALLLLPSQIAWQSASMCARRYGFDKQASV